MVVIIIGRQDSTITIERLINPHLLKERLIHREITETMRERLNIKISVNISEWQMKVLVLLIVTSQFMTEMFLIKSKDLLEIVMEVV